MGAGRHPKPQRFSSLRLVRPGCSGPSSTRHTPFVRGALSASSGMPRAQSTCVLTWFRDRSPQASSTRRHCRGPANLAAAARDAGVPRIVYLGGLWPRRRGAVRALAPAEVAEPNVEDVSSWCGLARRRSSARRFDVVRDGWLCRYPVAADAHAVMDGKPIGDPISIATCSTIWWPRQTRPKYHPVGRPMTFVVRTHSYRGLAANVCVAVPAGGHAAVRSAAVDKNRVASLIHGLSRFPCPRDWPRPCRVLESPDGASASGHAKSGTPTRQWTLGVDDALVCPGLAGQSNPTHRGPGTSIADPHHLSDTEPAWGRRGRAAHPRARPGR